MDKKHTILHLLQLYTLAELGLNPVQSSAHNLWKSVVGVGRSKGVSIRLPPEHRYVPPLIPGISGSDVNPG